MSKANEGPNSLPFGISLDPTVYAHKTDALIVRLNEVLKSPGGLTAFLGTFNYALYIIAHAEATAPSRAEIIAMISRFLGRVSSKVSVKPPVAAAGAAVVPSRITNLALAVADTRTTLRLTGLIPLYCLLKSLMRSRNDPNRDQVLHSIALGQCISFIGFQALENIYHLTAKGVLSSDISNKLTGGRPPMVMTYACRFWMAAVSLDFLRLWRESQLNSAKAARGEKPTPQEERERDAKWWSDFLVSCSWYPMAAQYAVEGGIGLNLGMVGACGFGAYLGRFLDVWRAAGK